MEDRRFQSETRQKATEARAMKIPIIDASFLVLWKQQGKQPNAREFKVNLPLNLSQDLTSLPDVQMDMFKNVTFAIQDEKSLTLPMDVLKTVVELLGGKVAGQGEELPVKKEEGPQILIFMLGDVV